MRRYHLLFIVFSLSCGSRVRQESVLGEGTSYQNTDESHRFKLPDGSSVLLKPGTRIVVAKGYSKDHRDIELDGEAFFEIVGGPVHVHTHDLLIEVLGAAHFHVDAFAKKAGEEVDVLAGKMRVSKSYHSDTDNEPEMLEAGDMVMINREIDLMEKEKLSKEELEKVKGGQ